MQPVQLKHARYDLLFLGAGLASLSLLMRLLDSEKFRDKKILLIDQDNKKKNDRTWCFWEKQNGFFEQIVCKSWPSISFLSDDYTAELNLAPYSYKMIRGKDLYDHCFQRISDHSNIEFITANIEDWQRKEHNISLTLNGQLFNLEAAEVFNSIYQPDPAQANATRVLQHFKGWMIETAYPSFDPSLAIMMDFRVSQHYGTSFGYLLPLSDKKAMVEYTQFTRELLKPEEYEKELKIYIEEILGVGDYRILETEFGVIPMTSEKFHFKGKAWNLGTAGGQTKASSGYTFQFIQKQSDQLAQRLINGQPLTSIKPAPARFRFYDNTLLHILYHKSYPGDKIFAQLFRKNKVQRVFRFLDNESSLAEELGIISSLPTAPFLKAAMRKF